jgi:hypothetical protein
MKSLLLLVVGMSCATYARSVGHVLTTKQAETLALNAPPTLNAAQGKCCPTAFGNPIAPSSAVTARSLIIVQVRCECGRYGGQLIDNYMVNPVTGKIWEGLNESGAALHSKRLDALRKQMLSSK